MTVEVQVQNTWHSLARDPRSAAVSVQRQSAGKIPSYSEDVIVFLKLTLSNSWTRSMHDMEGYVLYAKSTDLDVNPTERTPLQKHPECLT